MLPWGKPECRMNQRRKIPMNRYARKERKRGLAVLLAAVVLLACASFPQAAYDDFDEFTSHFSLSILQQMSVTRPSG